MVRPRLFWQDTGNNHSSHAIIEQAEVIFAGKLSSFQIQANDEDGYFRIGGDNNGAQNARFQIDAMASFLSNELKSCRDENTLQGPPVDWR